MVLFAANMNVAGSGLTTHLQSAVLLGRRHLLLGLRPCSSKHWQKLHTFRRHTAFPSPIIRAAAAERSQTSLDKITSSDTASQTGAIQRAEEDPFDQQRHQPSATQQSLPLQGSNANFRQKGLRKMSTQQEQTPQATAARIKHIWQEAVYAIKRAGPTQVLPEYIKRMDHYCSASKKQLSAQHFSAIIHGTAQVFITAEQSYGRHWQSQPSDFGLQDFISNILAMTPRFVSKLGCREVSSILWAFSKLNLNPDELKPGALDSLCQQFIEDIDSATDRSFASMMTACASLQLDPCEGALIKVISLQLTRTDMTAFSSQALVMITRSLVTLPTSGPSSELLDVLCNSFFAKLQLRVAHDPQSQSIANFAHALSKMPQAEPSPELLQALCNSFLDRLQLPTPQERPKAQEIAVFAYSFVSFPQTIPSAELLDALCDCFLKKIQSLSAQSRPTAQGIGLFSWALQKYRHVPSSETAATMLSRMLYLCHIDRMRPTPQNTSNLLFAFADLRLVIKDHEADILIRPLLARGQQPFQALTNTAWSLAVLGLLRVDTLKELLHAAHASSGYQSTAGVQQLYQAWEWVLCTTNASQQNQQALLKLQADLQQIGHRPEPVKTSTHSTGTLLAALSQLGLHCQPRYDVAGYIITAAVLPIVRSAPPIFVTYFDVEHFTNQPDRLTGRAVFTRKLLLRRGILIEVPREEGDQGADVLASYLAPRLEAATEGNLATYYKKAR